MNKRVVVTGLGAVTAIGIGKDAFWKNLIKGRSGISKVSLFDTSRFKCHNGGEIKDFEPGEFIPKRAIRFYGRASQFAIAATKLALSDARLTLSELHGRQASVIIGTTMAESNVLDISCDSFLRNKWKEVTNNLLISIFSPSIPQNIGCFFGVKNTNVLLPNACGAGNFTIGYGFDLIRKGEADVVIAGGSEALSRVAYQGFNRLYAMSPTVCSPFDKNRKGMLLGEGAGILILESFESARRRKASVYAEILGYGMSCDAHPMTIPKKEGVKQAMEKAIKNSQLSLHEIDYISAHGTGTVANDKTESAAIKELFGTLTKNIPVSSIKSMLGHSMGAASSLEAIACCLALQQGIIPPTINFKTPDPECDIDCVPNKARKTKLTIALNNGFAFGGNNCCTIIKNLL